MTSPLLSRLGALSKPDENGLLPCPVCWSKAEHEECDIWWFCIGCSSKDCPLYSGIDIVMLPDEAKKHWNGFHRPLLAVAKLLLDRYERAMRENYGEGAIICSQRDEDRITADMEVEIAETHAAALALLEKKP